MTEDMKVLLAEGFILASQASEKVSYFENSPTDGVP
jgi:hypothetical protein